MYTILHFIPFLLVLLMGNSKRAILKTLNQVASHLTLFEEVVTCINMDAININSMHTFVITFGNYIYNLIIYYYLVAFH